MILVKYLVISNSNFCSMIAFYHNLHNYQFQEQIQRSFQIHAHAFDLVQNDFSHVKQDLNPVWQFCFEDV